MKNKYERMIRGVPQVDPPDSSLFEAKIPIKNRPLLLVLLSLSRDTMAAPIPAS